MSISDKIQPIAVLKAEWQVPLVTEEKKVTTTYKTVIEKYHNIGKADPVRNAKKVANVIDDAAKSSKQAVRTSSRVYVQVKKQESILRKLVNAYNKLNKAFLGFQSKLGKAVTTAIQNTKIFKWLEPFFKSPAFQKFSQYLLKIGGLLLKLLTIIDLILSFTSFVEMLKALKRIETIEKNFNVIERDLNKQIQLISWLKFKIDKIEKLIGSTNLKNLVDVLLGRTKRLEGEFSKLAANNLANKATINTSLANSVKALNLGLGLNASVKALTNSLSGVSAKVAQAGTKADNATKAASAATTAANSATQKASTAQSTASNAANAVKATQQNVTNVTNKVNNQQTVINNITQKINNITKLDPSGLQKQIDSLKNQLTTNFTNVTNQIKNISLKPGKDGRDGKDGKDGKDGLPGLTQIVTLPGKDGKNGRNGAPGPAGKDGVTEIKVVEVPITVEKTVVVQVVDAETKAYAQAAATSSATAATAAISADTKATSILSGLGGITAAVTAVSDKVIGIANHMGLSRALQLVQLWVNLMTLATTAQNIFQIIGSGVDSFFSLFGFAAKAPDGSDLSFTTILNSTIESWVKSAVGADNYDNAKIGLANLSRINNAVSSMYMNVVSLTDPVRYGVGAIYEKVSQHRNEAIDDGALSERQKWDESISVAMSKDPLGKFVQGASLVENTTSSIASTIDSAVQAKDAYKQLGENRTEFDKARADLMAGKNAEVAADKSNSKPATTLDNFTIGKADAP